ncbi:hypothetical protein MUG91_G1295n3, partial [Manis pentadactyla]
MGHHGNSQKHQTVWKLPLLEQCKTPQNYNHPEVLRHTFGTLSNLHKLLPNHLMETLHTYKGEEDKTK